MHSSSQNSSTFTSEQFRRLLIQIEAAWKTQNYQIFKNRLKIPQFAIDQHPQRYGSWDGNRRILTLSEIIFTHHSWLEAIEVLRHEMAHQYVDEVLQIRHEPPHGPTFRKVCLDRGIDSRGIGTPQISEQSQKVLNRINKLLALAQSENPHEAETAANQAHALLVKHHLTLYQETEHPDLKSILRFDSSLCVADLLSNQETLNASWVQEQHRDRSFRQLGSPKKRHYEYEYRIIQILNDFFFVSAIWLSGYDPLRQKDGKVVEICGRYEDLDVAEYVYHFLYNHLDLMWKRYQQKFKVKGLKERLSYMLGVVQGFYTRLSEQQKKTQSSPYKTKNHQSKEERLSIQTQHHALMSLDRALSDSFLAQRHPRQHNRSFGGWSPTSTFYSGVQEGKHLHLHKGVSHSKQNRNKKLESF